MEIRRCGSVPTRRGPADWFTGTVWQEPVVEAPEPGRKSDTHRSIDPGGSMSARARFEVFDERSERGVGRPIRQPEVQQIDQRGRRGPANAREAGVLGTMSP